MRYFALFIMTVSLIALAIGCQPTAERAAYQKAPAEEAEKAEVAAPETDTAVEGTVEVEEIVVESPTTPSETPDVETKEPVAPEKEIETPAEKPAEKPAIEAPAAPSVTPPAETKTEEAPK